MRPVACRATSKVGEQERVVGALGPRLGDGRPLLRLPAVLNPQVQALVVVLGQRLVVVRNEAPLFVALALNHADLL